MNEAREARLIAAFSSLAAVLTDDYDVVGLLDTLASECVEVLESQAAGLLLTDSAGGLHLAAATDERASFVEMMQIDSGSGPCVECVRTGQSISVPDVAELGERWTDFQKVALEHGFRSVHTTPLRLNGRTVGGMNLFRSTAGAFDDQEAAVLQALTDVAAIGVMQQHRMEEANRVAEQLQRALDSRILIEQAKGVLAYAADLEVDAAFRVMRDYSRRHNLGLRAVADGIIHRRIDVLADPHAAASIGESVSTAE